MATKNTVEKRGAPEHPDAVNDIIAAANKNDRFKLLEDNGVLPGNLDNPIHPIFSWIDSDGPMNQMLRLASHFLTQDSALTFFIPLLYGSEVIVETEEHTLKTFLTNPFGSSSYTTRRQLVDGVRKALLCLAPNVDFSFVKPQNKRGYGRTLVIPNQQEPSEEYSAIFQGYWRAKVEIATSFRDFYEDKNGYSASSRCAQFRHDFLLASTLVHEIVHAFGIMRRGNLGEPYIDWDDPDNEWGYAWEHFMFGFVINPQDRTHPGTNLLMRKVWADSQLAYAAGGKEYYDVPMSYIAQWFRRATWDIIAEQGPVGVPPPITHFKLQASQTAWVVSSDSPDAKRDVRALHRWWQRQVSGSNSKICWQTQTRDELQKPNVEGPRRWPQRLSPPVELDQKRVKKKPARTSACHSQRTTRSSNGRKRSAGIEIEHTRSSKRIRRQ